MPETRNVPAKKKAPEDRRAFLFQVRLTKAEVAIVKKAVKGSGKSAADWILEQAGAIPSGSLVEVQRQLADLAERVTALETSGGKKAAKSKKRTK